MDLARKEEIEIEYWRVTEEEAPGSESVHNLINKITDAPNLLESLRPYEPVFAAAGSVLELGAGQGWASCMLKRLYPRAAFTVSDISEYAVASIPKWERVLAAKVDKAISCRSYEIPAEDSSFDCVFAYAAAHHFQAHRRTFRELRRVLKPGGQAFYFHEPCCRRWIYPMAYRRVNRTRHTVPEDVLIYPELLALAREAGFEANLRFTPTLNKRFPVEFVYYLGMRKLPFLQRLLPCTGTFQFINRK